VIFLAGPVQAGTPTVKNIMVSDVTPFSFCVIWSSSEPSQGSVDVFADINGTVAVAGILLEPQPLLGSNFAIRTAAEDLGVLKVRISGLSPDTAYYIQTVTTSKNAPIVTLRQPAPGALIAARTEVLVQRTDDSGTTIVPTGNDLLLVEARLPGGGPAPSGSLVILKLVEAAYPISSFVGDATPQPYQAYLDLNNFFSTTDGVTLTLVGGEAANLIQFMGTAGTSYARYSLPTNSASASPQSPSPDARIYKADYDGDLDIDGQDLNDFIGYFATLNSQADVNGDNSINPADVSTFGEFFGEVY
jgi:hypothetical protein